MADPSPKERLLSAAQAISAAATILRAEMPTFKAFMNECRDMDSFGHIVDPTLFKDSERRAVAAVVKPLFEAAIVFVKIHDGQLKSSRDALGKVSGND